MSSTKHTPKYSIGENDRGHGRIDYVVLKQVQEKVGPQPITGPLDFLTVNEIVTACNAHEPMLEALKRAAESLDQLTNGDTVDKHDYEQAALNLDYALDKITKATGDQS